MNGDGEYSTDLMEELLCYDLILRFEDDFRVSNPTFDLISLRVNDDGNGNLTQQVGCSHADGTPTTFRQTGNVVEYLYDDQVQFRGTVAADGTTITIQFTNDLLFGFNFFEDSDQVLREDGTLETYTGGATAVYTLFD